MGSRTTTTSGKQVALEEVRKSLDLLNTREAQVIRMLHGITEPETAAVGGPSEKVSDEVRARLHELEAELIKSFRDQAVDPKSKIIQNLRK